MVTIMHKTTPMRQVLTATVGAAHSTSVEYQLAPHVALAIVWDGSSRLIDASGACYGLPALSTTLLAITLRESMDRAVSEVASQYEVPPERVRADLDVFLSDLLRRGLLTRPGQQGGRRGVLWRLKAWPLSGALRLLVRVSCSDSRKARALMACAYASLRLLGWAQTIEIWQEKMACPLDPAEASDDTQRLDSINDAVREALSRSIFPVDCKARALCCWAMLRSAGHPARLMVGIDLFPFLGHCWCESGSRILGDGSDRCSRFTPVLQYN
jgi:hypothetical protein